MTTTLARYLLCLLLLMPIAMLQAQPQSDDTEATEQQGGDNSNNNSASDEQSDDGGTDTDLPDIDSQPIESSQNTGPGRFIPSEQISQDFGVSFPVDI